MTEETYQPTVSSARATESGMIVAVIDGKELQVPDDMSNRHRRAVAVWEVAGNTIEPFAEAIEAKRARAFLDRASFCIACRNAGILTPQEAKDAARGDWPVKFTPAIVGTPMEDDAEIIWAGAAHISRVHPLVAMLAAFANLDDVQLDAMFGV